MIKAVIFDMYETLITHFNSPLYFGKQMAEECLYIGDGGSRELETAEEIGMKAVQAVWYLRKGTTQPVGRKDEFEQAESPLEVLNFIVL